MKKPKLGEMKKRSVVLLLALILVGLILAGFIWGGELWKLFSDQDKIREIVDNAGPWGPVVLILLQVAQVIAAPIPGHLTAFAAGFLYGTVWGTIIAMIGATIGFILVMALARKLGRPFVEYFVDKKHLEKLDYLADSKGVFVFFLMALLPFFPDDLICFVAGLTRIPLKTLIVVTFLGRLPGNLALAFAGAGVADSNIKLVVVVLTIITLLSAIVWWKRERIELAARNFGKKSKSR